MHALVIQIFDPCVMKFSSLLDQQEVDSWNVSGLLTVLLDYGHPFILAKYIDGKAGLSFNLIDPRNGVGASVLAKLLVWEQTERRASLRQLSSLFFAFTSDFLFFTTAGRGI